MDGSADPNEYAYYYLNEIRRDQHRANHPLQYPDDDRSDDEEVYEQEETLSNLGEKEENKFVKKDKWKSLPLLSLFILSYNMKKKKQLLLNCMTKWIIKIK